MSTLGKALTGFSLTVALTTNSSWVISTCVPDSSGVVSTIFVHTFLPEKVKRGRERVRRSCSKGRTPKLRVGCRFLMYQDFLPSFLYSSLAFARSCVLLQEKAHIYLKEEQLLSTTVCKGEAEVTFLSWSGFSRLPGFCLTSLKVSLCLLGVLKGDMRCG